MQLSIQQIAQVCHQVNTQYCASLGDFSHKPWDESPPELQASVINGVGYHLANPNSKPSDSHENWMKVKTAEGWTYGEVKDFDKKTHPCYLPYDQLPPADQAKDYIFLGVVRALEKL